MKFSISNMIYEHRAYKIETDTHKGMLKENKTSYPISIPLIPSQMNFPHTVYPIYVNRMTIFLVTKFNSQFVQRTRSGFQLLDSNKIPMLCCRCDAWIIFCGVF